MLQDIFGASFCLIQKTQIHNAGKFAGWLHGQILYQAAGNTFRVIEGKKQLFFISVSVFLSGEVMNVTGEFQFSIICRNKSIQRINKLLIKYNVLRIACHIQKHFTVSLQRIRILCLNGNRGPRICQNVVNSPL